MESLSARPSLTVWRMLSGLPTVKPCMSHVLSEMPAFVEAARGSTPFAPKLPNTTAAEACWATLLMARARMAATRRFG